MKKELLEKKILHLTVTKKWFSEIESGKKKDEYREVKEYWTTRLRKNGKYIKFDEVHLKNGYKDYDYMVLEFKKTTKIFGWAIKSSYGDYDKIYYDIVLGKILKIKKNKGV